MGGALKPARSAATSAKADDEVLCDLDAVLSHRVTFTFQGKTHALLPITTERFFEFWQQVHEFEKAPQKTPAEINIAYHKMMSSICETVTPQEVAAMTVVQKATLLKHLVAKVVGNKSLFESIEKKNSIVTARQLAASQ